MSAVSGLIVSEATQRSRRSLDVESAGCEIVCVLCIEYHSRLAGNRRCVCVCVCIYSGCGLISSAIMIMYLLQIGALLIWIYLFVRVCSSIVAWQDGKSTYKLSNPKRTHAQRDVRARITEAQRIHFLTIANLRALAKRTFSVVEKIHFATYHCISYKSDL